LTLIANFSGDKVHVPKAPDGDLLYTTAGTPGSKLGSLDIQPFTTAWFLK
jgi:hypothetical protein